MMKVRQAKKPVSEIEEAEDAKLSAGDWWPHPTQNLNSWMLSEAPDAISGVFTHQKYN